MIIVDNGVISASSRVEEWIDESRERSHPPSRVVEEGGRRAKEGKWRRERRERRERRKRETRREERREG